MTPPNDQQSDDLTRKERREQARSQRKAAEEAQAASATRNKRLIQLGGLAGVVVVIIVVIVIATSGGSKNPEENITQGTKTETTLVSQISELLGGIPQHGVVLGDPNAPYTLGYWGDLECPICRDFTVDVLPSIIKEYVRPGKLKIEYHSFSTATGNAEAEGAEPKGIFKIQQSAAMAAGEQNKMWYDVELFYHEQGVEDSGYVTEQFIQKIAEQVPKPFSLTQWTEDRSRPKFEEIINSDDEKAIESHFEGTPSFLLGKTGSTPKQLSTGEYTEAGPYLEALKSVVG